MEFVSYKSENFVGIVTINRPNALNALNSQVLDELNEVFSKIDLEAVRAVILTGAGEKSFVAGADISE
ncbi:MAG: enoyl-CoA hydratase/isomerase family protein, partial [Fusobacterium sp.]|nr:enoyl-CoA hydratase/isomerase family protein [Fusobacterium sp.]